MLFLLLLFPEALLAAEELRQSGIETEFIDPRTIQPLDVRTIVTSVQKTGCLLIASDDFAIVGTGAGMVSAVLEDIFYGLRAPIRVIWPPSFPTPANPALEKEYVVDKGDMVAGVR